MSPRSAYPPHLQDIDEAWKGTDNASWLMRMKKRVQYWFSGGPRVPSGFWKFREIPKTLFAFGGKGYWRWENSDGSETRTSWSPGFYLSRIQIWNRYHVALQWPLFFSCHLFYFEEDVMPFPMYMSSFGIGKMFNFYIGWKRDADMVSVPTLFAGGNAE